MVSSDRLYVHGGPVVSSDRLYVVAQWSEHSPCYCSQEVAGSIHSFAIQKELKCLIVLVVSFLDAPTILVGLVSG